MATNRFTATVMATVLTTGALCLGAARPAAAIKKEEAWRYATYGLGAATVYGVAKNKDTIALLGAAGTYLTYSQWQKAKNQRREKERRARYGRSQRARSTYSSRRSRR